jgi:hypothetical protein
VLVATDNQLTNKNLKIILLLFGSALPYAQLTSITVFSYKPTGPPSGYNQYNFGNKVTGWIGWNAGINFF